MNEDTTEAPAEKSALDLALEDAQAKFPKRRLYAAKAAGQILIFGDPARAQYLYWRALVVSDIQTDKAKAADELMLACAVIPDRKGLTHLLENGYPGLALQSAVGAAVLKAAGITEEDEAKK